MTQSMKTLPLRGANPATEMPALGFGTWKITGDDCRTAVLKALEIGYRHIDTAQNYENEAEVGAALAASGLKRDEIFVTTKIGRQYYAPGVIEPSVDASLEKLQLEQVDLLLLHWPNPDFDLSQTLQTLKSFRDAGKTKAIGISNFPVALMEKATEILGDTIACNQVEYHALLSQKPVLEYARAHDMVVTAYSPLATGKLRDHPLLTEIGMKHGKSAGQVALRWLIDQPGVAAIPKAVSEANMRANFDIFDFELSADDYAALNDLNARSHERMISPGFAPVWDKAA